MRREALRLFCPICLRQTTLEQIHTLRRDVCSQKMTTSTVSMEPMLLSQCRVYLWLKVLTQKMHQRSYTLPIRRSKTPRRETAKPTKDRLKLEESRVFMECNQAKRVLIMQIKCLLSRPSKTLTNVSTTSQFPTIS